MSQPIVVAALYKFVTLKDYEALREPLHQAMLAHDVKGTLLLAEEGITVLGDRVQHFKTVFWEPNVEIKEF